VQGLIFHNTFKRRIFNILQQQKRDNECQKRDNECQKRDNECQRKKRYKGRNMLIFP